MKKFEQILGGQDTLQVNDLTMILFGHAAFQYLNAGFELRIFEILQEQPGLNKIKLAEITEIKDRPLNCLLLGLVSLKLIVKDNDLYYNSQLLSQFFENGYWRVLKTTVKFEAEVVYSGQADFVKSLIEDRNVGLRRIVEPGDDLYNKLNKSELLYNSFYEYMSAWTEMSLPILVNNFDFGHTDKILDVGGGDATFAIEICKKHPNISIDILEIPENSTRAKSKISEAQLDTKISIIEGDMFITPFPNDLDAVMFIHQLVIWSKEKILFLLNKSFESLKDGGYVLIFSSLTSDDESGPLMGALDSVYFVSIPSDGGMIYSYGFYRECLQQVGFKEVKEFGPFNSWSPHGFIIAYK